MRISELQNKVDQWIKDYGVRYFSEITNTLILQEEMGEFARLVSRIYGEQSFKKDVDPENHKSMLADEIADIMFVLTCLANQMDIDLEHAMIANLDKKTNRDQQRHHNNPKLSD